MMNFTSEQLDKIQIHFIVARARTGSTLLLTMLNQHENILCIHEQAFAFFLYPKYHKIKHWTPKVIHAYCKDFFLFSRYNLDFQFSDKKKLGLLLERHKAVLNYERVIRLTSLLFIPQKDKSSIKHIVFKELNMAYYLNQSRERFPKSKLLFLYRNPLDTVSRKRNLESIHKKVLYSISRVALEWNYTSQLILKKRCTNEGLTVYYEQLISEPKKQLVSICNYLGLDFQEEMLNYSSKIRPENIVVNEDKKYKISNEENRALHIGLTKKPDKSKINAWKNELTPNEAAVVWEITKKSAIEMGYSKDESIQAIKLGARHYFSFVYSFFRNQLIIANWYKLPFFVQRNIKRIKVFLGMDYL